MLYSESMTLLIVALIYISIRIYLGWAKSYEEREDRYFPSHED